MMNMADQFSNAAEIAARMADKMMAGYQILSEIDEIDVATAEKELIWQLGRVKVYHYISSAPKKSQTPTLISYALVNRQDMMDLQPDRSYIRNLLNLGLDLYIIDWGYPTAADKYDSLEDYIEMYLDGAVDAVCEDSGQSKINLMGICQGGTFSVIYSALHPEKIKNLVTLVTPIDFSTNDGLLIRWSKDMDIDALVDANGNISGDFLNVGFATLKPMMQAGKVMNLMSIIDDKDKLMNYLRMEKWINDSPDQAGECYRQFLKDLYQENKLANNELKIGRRTVNLKDITMPVMNVYATEDHLVPPAATIPLNDLIGSKDKSLYKFPGGHIGVFVGGRSQKELAPAVAEFLISRD